MSDRARVALALAVGFALTVAVLLYLRSPEQRTPPPPAGPLASPLVTPGAVGGLLPAVTLRGRSGPTDARRLRPGIVMLVAPGCRCVEQVRQVVADAAPFGLVTYIVGGSAGEAEALAAQSGGAASGFADPDGALAAAYGLRSEAALVLVRNDGVVTQVVAAIARSLRLDAAFRGLV